MTTLDSGNRTINDEELLQAIAAHNHDALMTLYQRYASLVYSLALRVLHQPQLAEEVTQDVFFKVWQRPERWNPAYGQFSSWLLTITRNAAIDRMRREERHRVETYVADYEQPATAGLHVDEPLWINGQLLRKLLLQLPSEQRHLIELAYFSGHTHSDLAERLNLPLGTVKTRLRIGLQKLRQLWNEATTESENHESNLR